MPNHTSFFLYLFCSFVCLWHSACGISVCQPRIELGPWQWKCWILTTRPPGNSQGSFKILILTLIFVCGYNTFIFLYADLQSPWPLLFFFSVQVKRLGVGGREERKLTFQLEVMSLFKMWVYFWAAWVQNGARNPWFLYQTIVWTRTLSL